jgi:hypothetical protein
VAKMPFMKFFPKDWLGDERLRLCSVAARGLWIDLLCLMHSAPRRGYLQTATGTPLPLEQIARMAGCSTDEASRLLRELTDSGVCDCNEHGAVYSRRMVREAGISLVRSELGRKGADATNGGRVGKPAGKGVGKPPANGPANGRPSEVQKLRDSEAQIRHPPNPPRGPGGESPEPGVSEIVAPPRMEEVQAAWNAVEGVTHSEHVAPVHRSMLAARGHSRLFCDRWRDGIEAVRRSARCKGASGWRADLKWFLKDGSLEELLNGSFEDVTPDPKAAGPPVSKAVQAVRAARQAREGQSGG